MGTLSETHMLVEVNMKCPSGTTRNKTLEHEAETTHGVTDRDRVRAVVDVFNTDYLKKVRKCQAALRNEVSAMTLPWSERGQRLIPNIKMKQLKDMVDKTKVESSSAWKDFCDNLEHHKARDKQVLGTLFDDALYPSKDELEGRHSVDVVFATVPDPQHDVRSGWDTDTVSEYQAQVVEKEKVRTAKAMKALAKRCHDLVERVADRCKNYTGGKAGSFNDTLIPNVRDMIEMCNLFNLDNDAEIKQWVEDMSTSICTVSSQDLRESPELRKEIGDAAGKLVNRIAGSNVGAFGRPQMPSDRS